MVFIFSIFNPLINQVHFHKDPALLSGFLEVYAKLLRRNLSTNFRNILFIDKSLTDNGIGVKIR